MAVYTTLTRTVAEQTYLSMTSGSPRDLQGKTPDDILDVVWGDMFPFRMTDGNGLTKENVVKSICKHYWMREIGMETVGLWRFSLGTRLEEIMPKYQEMALAQSEMGSVWETQKTSKRHQGEYGKTGNDSGSDSKTGNIKDTNSKSANFSETGSQDRTVIGEESNTQNTTGTDSRTSDTTQTDTTTGSNTVAYGKTDTRTETRTDNLTDTGHESVTTTGNSTVEGTGKSVLSGTTESATTGTDTTESAGSVSTTGKTTASGTKSMDGKVLESDTPQNGLSDVIAGNYLSKATVSDSDETTNSTVDVDQTDSHLNTDTLTHNTKLNTSADSTQDDTTSSTTTDKGSSTTESTLSKTGTVTNNISNTEGGSDSTATKGELHRDINTEESGTSKQDVTGSRNTKTLDGSTTSKSGNRGEDFSGERSEKESSNFERSNSESGSDEYTDSWNGFQGNKIEFMSQYNDLYVNIYQMIIGEVSGFFMTIF